MAENSSNGKNPGSQARESFGPSPPQLNLPKGGGAIRGIGEKFAATPVTGTGALSLPIFVTPGRSGFSPKLTLSYDSGSGNGSFGFAWSVALPSVTRKTDKGLPRYDDGNESDVFILSGAEDLTPQLTYDPHDGWTREISQPRAVYGKQYIIHAYRPRVEGLFARIERWVNANDSSDTFWRSISKENTTTWYGKTSNSRIADPADTTRIFSWLICESYDDKGNVIAYEYKPENSENLDLSQANERNRTETSRSVNRYIKSVSYGNRTPYFPDLNADAPAQLPADWCFQLVFDYGEHDLGNPTPQEVNAWSARADAFSTYRPAFEVRTYRLCRRALMFHHFENEPGVGLNCVVRSTDLTHSRGAPADPSQPFYSFLLSATQTGYVRQADGGYVSKSLPAAEFEYSEAQIDESVQEIDAGSLANLPYGLDGSHYRWVDLDGDGVSGILTEQGGTWFYKPNLSPASPSGDGGAVARFGPVEVVARHPSLAALAEGRQQLMDLSGDGQLDVVEFESPAPGFYERTADRDWQSFRTFDSLPVLDWKNPNLKFVDLTGDGLADLFISEDDKLLWHASLSIRGFGPEQRVTQALDEERGPKFVFSDGTQTIFLADMTGDGLADLVRVRASEIVYWPNLGFGKFGAKVTMDNAPWLDSAESFDARRVHLADIDGSGTADVIYFGSGEVYVHFNQSGNSWGARRTISFPQIETISSATTVDLLGKGTACLVWSSPLEMNLRRPMRYIDLLSQGKPHLLRRLRNTLGTETVVTYCASTKFYVEDRLADTPWLTRLPFPVHVVEKVETYDYISRNRFVTRYTYHHGFFDGVEREFRGFGRVDQYDTEEFTALGNASFFPPSVNEDAVSAVPPVLTRTWFHTGAFFDAAVISKHLEPEYYAEGDNSQALSGLKPAQLEAMLLDDTLLPASILLPDGSRIAYDLTGDEMREACRALRGSVLRQEIYGEDGSEAADRPYSVAERNYTIEMLQPHGPNLHAVFFAHARESLDFRYDRKLFDVAAGALADSQVNPNTHKAADPRVTHQLTLAVDPFGNVLQSANVAYGRRFTDPQLTAADQQQQSTTVCTYNEIRYTNLVQTADAYRTPLVGETTSYALLQAVPDGAQLEITNLFGFDELAGKMAQAGDGHHDVPFETLAPAGLNANECYRRLLARSRTYYRPDDLGAAVGDRLALLPLGQTGLRALPGCTYKLAFTPGLINQVYQRAGNALLPTPDNVLGSAGTDGGGYVLLDGNWWAASGRIFYAIGAVAPAAESAEATLHFYLARRYEDAFGNPTEAGYDTYDLLVATTTDAIGNTASARNDYRVASPAELRDPNGNRAAVSFDVLGAVAGTAVMGKVTENLGDSLDQFVPDLSQAQIDGFFGAADPASSAIALLGNATTRVIYDVNRFATSQSAAPADLTRWEPVFAAIITREIHASDLVPGQSTKVQIRFRYFDGFGRQIQQKLQAEPGPVVDGGAVVDPRWVVSGWTIFNNKGNPIRQYEPFFSRLANGHQFEFGVSAGVSPIVCYDPVGRTVARIFPNHAFEKSIFEPWREEKWDVNDTVLIDDPASDVNIGAYFARLPAADYSPTWHARRIGGALGVDEQDAAKQTESHAGTPTRTYFDPLGRSFLSIADNAADGEYSSRIESDIQGNQRAVRDALVQAGDAQGRIVVRFDYDLLQNRIHQASMEAGERWMLSDVRGNPVRSWDSRGHNFRTEYDTARRAIAQYVLGTDAANSDARTTAGEVLYEKIVYGEQRPNPELLNLRTRVYQHYDVAGVVTNQAQNPATNQDEAYDFKGNLLRTSRAFLVDHKALPDWNAGPAVQPGFTSSMKYDALNRVLESVAPEHSSFTQQYNVGGLLETLSVSVRGGAATTFVSNLDYDARGQRVLAEYGNQVATAYQYEDQTFRLARLATTRAGVPANQQAVQDLQYTYDPAGNITRIADDAQDDIFFANQKVEPSTSFTYDSIYRLISATGREQLGLTGAGQPLPPAAGSYNDVPRVRLQHPGDGKAMGLYTEQYQYDEAGNFKSFIHRGTNPVDPGWTRTYSYNEGSLLEPGKFSNRLTQTTISGNQPVPEKYTYDLHGSLINMPQLQQMQWSFNNQLLMTRRQAVNASDDDGQQHQGEGTYYVYSAAGQRVRKVTESGAGLKIKERFYLGAFELYREYDGAGSVTLERETLHVMDGETRVALVESKTIDKSVPPTNLPTTTTRYQFENHLGTTCLELDENAAILTYEEYFPFGGTSYQAGRSVAEASLKRYRYSGKERDEESGLYYHGARYYAPWIGRWTSCDPIGIVDGLDLYVYVSNNPVRLMDKSGHEGTPKNDATGAQSPPTTKEKVKSFIADEEALLHKIDVENAPLRQEQAELVVSLLWDFRGDLTPDKKTEKDKIESKIKENAEKLKAVQEKVEKHQKMLDESKEMLKQIEEEEKLNTRDDVTFGVDTQSGVSWVGAGNTAPGTAKVGKFSWDVVQVTLLPRNWEIIPLHYYHKLDIALLKEPGVQVTVQRQPNDPGTPGWSTHTTVGGTVDLFNISHDPSGWEGAVTVSGGYDFTGKNLSLTATAGFKKTLWENAKLPIIGRFGTNKGRLYGGIGAEYDIYFGTGAPPAGFGGVFVGGGLLIEWNPVEKPGKD